MIRKLVNVVIPVYNEERVLEPAIRELISFLSARLAFRFEVVIAENGSTDRTFEVANRLTAEFPFLQVIHLEEKGRGMALKRAWSRSKADVLSYMDVDLSSDLETFPALVEPLASGHKDIATGSRLLRPELTSRRLKREFISRSYNFLIKAMFRTTFSDAQCGFKAITRSAAQVLLPQIEDTGWFFDTELLILAEKQGYRIFDLPIQWIERRESHVRIFRTAVDDIKGLIRIRRSVARLTLKPHSHRKRVGPELLQSR